MGNHEIAKVMWQLGAVRLGHTRSFTWTSGIRSPIYCDHRITISYPEVRVRIVASLEEMISATWGRPDVVAGVGMAAIPYAAWIAQDWAISMVFARPTRKGHGMRNEIEGALQATQRVIVVEDVFSTGGSARKAIRAVEGAGGVCVGVAGIFSYNLPQFVRMKEDEARTWCVLYDYETVVDVGLREGYITDDDLKRLKKWRASLGEQAK